MKNWTIGKRILFGFGTLIAITLTLGAIAFNRLEHIKELSTRIVVDCIPGLYNVGQIDAINKENWASLQEHISAETKEKKEAIEARMKEKSAELTRIYKDYEKSITTDRDRELFIAVGPLREKYSQVRSGVVLRLSREMKTAEALEALEKELRPAFDEYAKAIHALVEFNEKNGEEAGAAIDHDVRTAERAIIVGVAVCLVIGIVIALVIIRGTSRVLTHVATTLDDGSSQVASAATQVSSASQSLAEGASEQAASLEETSASLEEMSSMTKRNAENAETAKNLANQTRVAADNGASDMKQMSTAMDAIKSSSDNIAKIIKTIDEIAFQTNILALNAAVEAARAGEAGMGFAVVADEVRNLAQRSAQAAKETAEKIEDSIRKSDLGVQISGKVAHSLAEIVEKARKVDELVGEIASASREQSQGIQQVNIAVTQMDKVTQSNAANAEESASASEELNAQAATLKDAVEDLVKLVGGKAESKKAAKSVAPSDSVSMAKVPKTKVTTNGHSPALLPVKGNGNGNGNGHSNGLALAVSKSRKEAELPMDDDFRDF